MKKTQVVMTAADVMRADIIRLKEKMNARRVGAKNNE